MVQHQKVSIIGCGTIGRSWAILFLNSGFEVSLFDQSSDQVSGTQAFVYERIRVLRESGILRSDLPLERISASLELSESLKSCLINTCYVQECVPEDLALKQSIFQSIERTILDEIDDQSQKSTVILASSTSTLSTTKISENLRLKNRFLVAHPINPPYLMKLVELVPAQWTNEDVVDKVYEMMVKLGRTPIKVKKDLPGFVLNRLQYALIAECWRLISDDVADPEDLEKAVTEGLGPRYAFAGILETMHLNTNGIVNHANRYNDVYMAVRRESQATLSLQEPDVLAKVKKYLENKAPADQLDQRRLTRDRCLTRLAQLKKELNE